MYMCMWKCAMLPSFSVQRNVLAANLQCSMHVVVASHRSSAFFSSCFEALCTTSRKLLATDKMMHLHYVCGKASRAAACGDNRQLFKLARNLGPFKIRAIPSVRISPNDPLSLSPEEYAKCFFEHFKKLFGASEADSVDTLDRHEPSHHTR